jgi:hypothetical protein
MTHTGDAGRFSRRLVFGPLAGLFAASISHGLTPAGLWGLGFAPSPPFSMAPTEPSCRYLIFASGGARC